MRRLWRWLTGRTLKDAMPSWNIPTREAYVSDLWPQIREYYGTGTSDLDDGRFALLNGKPVETKWADWNPYAVTEEILRDDFYERVASAPMPPGASTINTLHDSSMMARIAAGKQAEYYTIPYWADMGQAVPRAVPHTIDPYLWHDVGELIEQARRVMKRPVILRPAGPPCPGEHDFGRNTKADPMSDHCRVCGVSVDLARDNRAGRCPCPEEIAEGFGVVEEYGREGDGIALFCAPHPLGPAMAEDADISEDALETVEMEVEIDIPESFANHPVSLAEVRSDKSENAADWTPRDALIWLLRKIDSGEVAPTTIMVMYGESTPEGRGKSSYVTAGGSVHEAMGILAHETFKYHLHCEGED